MHTSELWPATTTTDSQGNFPKGIFPKSVGESKLINAALPSKLKTAAMGTGGGDTASFATTAILDIPSTKLEVNSPSDVPDSVTDSE
jgi:hypothetical protein